MDKQFCNICLWNDSFTFFNCSEYTLPPINSELYNLYIFTGYNHVININSYNPMYVCNECLLFTVYNCNFELKYNLLKELKIYNSILEIMKKFNLPNEMFRIIYKFNI